MLTRSATREPDKAENFSEGAMFLASLACWSCSSRDRSANHLQTGSGYCSTSHALAFSRGFRRLTLASACSADTGRRDCRSGRAAAEECRHRFPGSPPGSAASHGARFAGWGAAVQSPSPAGASPAARSGFSHPPASSNCGEVQLLFFFLCTEHVFPISELAWRLEDVVAEPCADPAPPAAASAGRVLVACLGPALSPATAPGRPALPRCPHRQLAHTSPPGRGWK